MNLKKPQTLNEKICYIMVHDRNPLLASIMDKYCVREYLEEKLGSVEAKNILVKLYYSTENPSTIPFGNLPDEFVIKSSHTSGKEYIIIKNKDDIINEDEIIEKFSKILERPYRLFTHLWASKKIKRRRIVVEELLKNSNGELPSDYKFFVFNGKVKIILLITDRFGSKKFSFYSSDWELLDATYKGIIKGDYLPPPANLNEMIRMAEYLGNPFDFIRVDLYNIDGIIKFGEFTIYSAKGMAPFYPECFDLYMGSLLQINNQK